MGVDFDPSRYAGNDEHRLDALELGLGWMLRGLDDDRAVHRPARSGARDRRGHVALDDARPLVDPQDYDRMYDEAGMVPPKDHTPVIDD